VQPESHRSHERKGTNVCGGAGKRATKKGAKCSRIVVLAGVAFAF
jgi:hypothetical protein